MIEALDTRQFAGVDLLDMDRRRIAIFQGALGMAEMWLPTGPPDRASASTLLQGYATAAALSGALEFSDRASMGDQEAITEVQRRMAAWLIRRPPDTALTIEQPSSDRQIVSDIINGGPLSDKFVPQEYWPYDAMTDRLPDRDVLLIREAVNFWRGHDRPGRDKREPWLERHLGLPDSKLMSMSPSEIETYMVLLFSRIDQKPSVYEIDCYGVKSGHRDLFIRCVIGAVATPYSSRNSVAVTYGRQFPGKPLKSGSVLSFIKRIGRALQGATPASHDLWIDSVESVLGDLGMHRRTYTSTDLNVLPATTPSRLNLADLEPSISDLPDDESQDDLESGVTEAEIQFREQLERRSEWLGLEKLADWLPEEDYDRLPWAKPDHSRPGSFEYIVKRALCAQTDPEAFFPDKGAPNEDAKLLCGRCAVQQECATYAVNNPGLEGIYGGMTPKEVRKERKRQKLLQREPDE